VGFNGDVHVNLLPDAEVGPYVGAGITSFHAYATEDSRGAYTDTNASAIAGFWLNRPG
jgi:hypothetical protein